MKYGVMSDVIVLMSLVTCGCTYTEEELIQQLYEKDSEFSRQVRGIQNATSNRVEVFRSQHVTSFAQQMEQLTDMKQQLLGSYRKEDADVRKWLMTGDLQNYHQALVPTYGKMGYFASLKASFQGLILQSRSVVLHFRNIHAYHCKPSVRVTFYDQHLEILGKVEETWFWTSLAPSEEAKECNSLPFDQVPYYFKVEHLR